MINNRNLYLLSLFKFLFIFIIFFSIGCQEKNKEENYIARVNDAYLFEKDLNVSHQTFNKNKDELINNWIDNELLYQEAKKGGLTDDDEFKLKLEVAKKQIAKALLLQNYFEDNKITLDANVLKDFYEKNKNALRLKQKSFYINQIIFNNEESAQKFRNLLTTTNWERIISFVNKNSDVVSITTKKLFYDYELPNYFIFNVVSGIDENEITPILELGNNKYIIIQLLKKYNENDIPEYDVIQKEVQEFFIQVERKKLLEDYLKELYSKNEVEIK
ncbi:MAG: peptidyl-prolyl cis-trans isomerase [Ignavibacterium sp.]